MNARQVWCQSDIGWTMHDTVWHLTKIMSTPSRMKMAQNVL